MKKYIRSAIVFLATCGFVALLAWCAGYNFDRRSDELAFIVFITTISAITLAIVFKD